MLAYEARYNCFPSQFFGAKSTLYSLWKLSVNIVHLSNTVNQPNHRKFGSITFRQKGAVQTKNFPFTRIIFTNFIISFGILPRILSHPYKVFDPVKRYSLKIPYVCPPPVCARFEIGQAVKKARN